VVVTVVVVVVAAGGAAAGCLLLRTIGSPQQTAASYLRSWQRSKYAAMQKVSLESGSLQLLTGGVATATAAQAKALGAPYQAGDQIGQGGIEQVYQARLAGRPSLTIREGARRGRASRRLRPGVARRVSARLNVQGGHRVGRGPARDAPLHCGAVPESGGHLEPRPASASRRGSTARPAPRSTGTARTRRPMAGSSATAATWLSPCWSKAAASGPTARARSPMLFCATCNQSLLCLVTKACSVRHRSRWPDARPPARPNTGAQWTCFTRISHCALL
jgi:hypothetical protein